MAQPSRTISGRTPSTNQFQALQTRIAELQEQLDNSNKMDQLEDAQQQVALAANEILNRLPFVDLYPPRAVYVNSRDISAGVLTAQRRIPMRDIGSDEKLSVIARRSGSWVTAVLQNQQSPCTWLYSVRPAKPPVLSSRPYARSNHYAIRRRAWGTEEIF
jgi:hypothetical protein